jgi:hypothetical protein
VEAANPLLDPEFEELLGRSRAKRIRRLLSRELAGETVAAAGFLIAAITLAVLAPWRPGFSLPLALVLAGSYALASRVRFEVGPCHTDASQLVLVPMLLLLPAACVPLVAALGYVAGELPDYLRGHKHLERVVVSLANSWYAVGPAVVLAIAGGARSLQDWPILLAALGAQFAVDAAVNAPREWFELGASPRTQLPGAAWTYGVDALLSCAGLLAAFASRGEPYAFVLLLPLVALLAIFAKERERRLDGALQLSDAYRATTGVLAEVVEWDDNYTGSHSRRVVALSLSVADALGVQGRARRNVEFGALLHDVGKIAIPKEIVNKPGPLSASEWETMRRHTLEGQRILDRVGGTLGEAGHVVRASHERWDGTGYPDGLAGEHIPIEARIVSCCDAFHAMTSDRTYRRALPEAVALDELRACAGTHFDPRVVRALVAMVELSRSGPAPSPALAQAG